jgi:hypothetical protein
MRHKYREALQKKLNESKDNVYLDLNDKKFKLEFLRNESYRKYFKRIDRKNKKNETEEVTKLSNVLFTNNKEEKQTSSSRSTKFAPLSLNALMEYKQVIVANGSGDFDQGRPKMFKVKN